MLYQVGTLQSLMAGVDEGDRSLVELRQYGDFGLGTFDGINGELIVIDGKFWIADGKGNLREAEVWERTPFAVLTFFSPERRFSLDHFENMDALTSVLLEYFDSQNLIYALKIRGKFVRLHLRSERRHGVKHRPLTELLPTVQTEFTLEQSQGEIVGFWFPHYMRSINLPGFHFHYLDRMRSRGGHLFDATGNDLTIELMTIHDFGMHLLQTPLFEKAKLEAEDSEMIFRMESGKKRRQK